MKLHIGKFIVEQNMCPWPPGSNYFRMYLDKCLISRSQTISFNRWFFHDSFECCTVDQKIENWWAFEVQYQLNTLFLYQFPEVASVGSTKFQIFHCKKIHGLICLHVNNCAFGCVFTDPHILFLAFGWVGTAVLWILSFIVPSSCWTSIYQLGTHKILYTKCSFLHKLVSSKKRSLEGSSNH